MGHATKLKEEFAATDVQRAARGLAIDDPQLITFELQPHARKMIDSLERAQSRIDLLSVREQPDKIVATVRVPAEKRSILEAILHRYETQETDKGRPKNQDLVENIDQLRLATEDDLWTDSVPFPTATEPIWWEVWLFQGRGANSDQVHNDFTKLAEEAGLTVSPRRVVFPDRVVALVYGSFESWQSQPRLLLHVAELRKAKELASEFLQLDASGQADIVSAALQNIVPPPEDAPAVCLLDTGVDRKHPLLEIGLSPEDTQAVDPSWGADDHNIDKHGTGMAGIALYGSLTESLLSDTVNLTHRLESVKILPRNGANDPELYGNITQEAVARAEATAPDRNRVTCLTVTADSRDGGFPSSWSGAIDQMCVGGPIVGDPKLICVAAGNLRDEISSPEFEYPVIEGESSGIEDPGQSWNALTVGAFTELVVINDQDYNGYEPIAPIGDISPTSRTSLAWPESARNGWPLKPEIVVEGGNWAVTPGGIRDCPDDLGLLTTIVHSSGRLFTVTRDTSPATAAASRLAALVWGEYPNLWPETVRGLLVHSARWTDAMQARFPGSTKAITQRRLRCYGYGVPNIERALYSAENKTTLLFEGSLQPYRLDGSTVKSNEMHVHELPWPHQILEELGDISVRMRVTLSYYVEPSPGRRGWTRRHRYASHGLRFDVKRPTETPEQFIQRISDVADNDDEIIPVATTQSQPWVVGPNGRSQGSVHSDWWEGTAADLAASGLLAVYPVTGWWRERKHLERWGSRARYSLIISLETEADVQLYTAIQSVTTVSVEVAT